jgi:pimeloyl-ACP methyl ester carboxylesterase
MIKVTTISIFFASALLTNSVIAAQESRINTDPNFNPDPTLFKGAANNIWIEVLFKAAPAAGSDSVPVENLRVDLRPDREMTLNVEIYNPEGAIPLIVTPGGMGDIEGFGAFAKNLAAASSDLKVIIMDRRNLGRSEVSFANDEPLGAEEAEDLHVLLQRLGIESAIFYGMSSGSRSNMVLAERHPEQVDALIIAPLTGGPIAAQRLSDEYFLSVLRDDSLTSMEAVAQTPLWEAYLERNSSEVKEIFFEQNVEDFLATMKMTGEHLASFHAKTTLGMTDEQLIALDVPATLILHHGDEIDFLHPKVNSRAATTLIKNSSFKIAPSLEAIVDAVLPFVKKHTSALEPKNMGEVINSVARDAEPTFTADGQTMYFNCFDRQGEKGSDICVSHLQGTEWTEPSIVWEVSTRDYLEVEPLLSPDGQQLYIMSTRPGGKGGMDLWVSDLVGRSWTSPRNLDGPINSAYADHCLYFAGKEWETAYWTSTRPGGFGGNDIWTSERIDGVWQDARNLGPNVNSAATEHHSLPSPDGNSLYVTSIREGGFGGEDIFVTTRNADGVWGELVNLGGRVNSDQNDRCPAFSPNFKTLFFDSERSGGFGDKDLWSLPYSAIEDIR